jgi:hypothetical protein
MWEIIRYPEKDFESKWLEVRGYSRKLISIFLSSLKIIRAIKSKKDHSEGLHRLIQAYNGPATKLRWNRYHIQTMQELKELDTYWSKQTFLLCSTFKGRKLKIKHWRNPHPTDRMKFPKQTFRHIMIKSPCVCSRRMWTLSPLTVIIWLHHLLREKNKNLRLLTFSLREFWINLYTLKFRIFLLRHSERETSDWNSISSVCIFVETVAFKK